SKLPVDRLHGAGGEIIKGEIGRLVGLFPEAIEIGLVPYLEIPAAHLLPAVALFEMADESVYERAPHLRHRMRGVALPPENAVVGRLERLGSETELDERLDVLGQELVVELVDAGPVIG